METIVIAILAFVGGALTGAYIMAAYVARAIR
jgi:hypothetical protein